MSRGASRPKVPLAVRLLLGVALGELKIKELRAHAEKELGPEPRWPR